MVTIKDDISGHFQSFDFRINEEIKYCLRHNLPRAHLGLARLVANWLVGWWLWRATCISQDTYLLYFMYIFSSSNFSLHIRVDDIIHANGPIYNSKSDRHDRADEMRQNCRLSKSSFGFCALLLGIPGNFITVD